MSIKKLAIGVALSGIAVMAASGMVSAQVGTYNPWVVVLREALKPPTSVPPLRGQAGSLTFGESVSDSVGIDLIVDAYARISSSDARLALRLIEPTNMGGWGEVASTKATYTLHANTDVLLTVQETLSAVIVDDGGAPREGVYANWLQAVGYPAAKDAPWFVSFEPWIDGSWTDSDAYFVKTADNPANGNLYGQAGYKVIPAGAHQGTIEVRGTWTYGGDDNGNKPTTNPKDWWMLKAGFYSGTLTVTVSLPLGL